MRRWPKKDRPRSKDDGKMNVKTMETSILQARQKDLESPVSEYPSLPPLPSPRGRDKRTLMLLLTPILLTAVLIFALILVSPRATSPTTQQLTSSNWSGYCVASDLNTPQPQVTSLSASWTVPAVSVSIGNSYSAAWIGVGGQFDKTLIQAGTEQDSIDGREVYTAWYELLPRDAVTIDSLSISSGDKITGSISLSNQTANTWLIEITDVTNGQSFEKSIVYVSSMLSAEWIVEAPMLVNRVATLANFGQITFTDCKATIGGVTGTINSFPSGQITLNGRQHVELATVSTYTSGGSSFTVNYDGWQNT